MEEPDSDLPGGESAAMGYRELLFGEYVDTMTGCQTDFSEEAYRLRVRAYRERFRGYLPANKSAQILDVGCGVGFFLRFLQANGYMNAVGIDTSPQQVSVARRFGVRGVTECEWKSFLTGKSSQFEFILIDNVIEHLHKDEITELLQLVLMALVPGGRVYVSTPNAGSLFGAPLAFIDLTHEVFFTLASLRQVLMACGFVGVNVFGERIIASDVRSVLRKAAFSILKPLVKAAYIVGTGGGGRTRISHVIEPSLGAVAERSRQLPGE
jgi:2-polyprenyl-3-methyl-5-hydroxy-6-metoxy-1,4-benzoquinol methylase